MIGSINHHPSSINRVAILVAALALSSCDRPEPPAPPPTPAPTATPTPAPTPTPVPQIERKQIDISRLYGDIQVRSNIVENASEETASHDRKRGDAYELELTLRVDIPVASRTLPQIERNDPKLVSSLPGLADRLTDARVSPAFADLYKRKVDYLRPRLNRIDTLLNRHNFYDCDTILELENPATGRRALFLQGDMDVNTDGSDGDRNFAIDGSSMFFQPQTSYRWRRQTDRPNQFFESTKKRLAELQKEFAIPGLGVEKNRALRDGIAKAESTLYELEHYSFLISGADPYIVLPTFMLREMDGPFAPAIGDYAVVLHGGVAYPAILGDAGPSFKFGEASVRLCQQINPRSSAISRPVSDLTVTYIVFPGSKDEAAGPPDLARWHARSAELLADLGVRPAQLHEWENLIKTWPTPTPTPTPEPTPTPTPTPTPEPPPTPTPETPAQDLSAPQVPADPPAPVDILPTPEPAAPAQ